MLVKGRKSGKWSFPKGHKNRSETYIDCAKRETLEETGIDLADCTPVQCERMSVGEYYFFTLPSEVLPAPTDTREIIEAGWFSVDEMNRMPCNVDVNFFLRRMRC